MDEKIITVDISKSKFLRANPQWEYNYGQKLKFEGVQLPSYYQVHFSNSIDGEAKTQIGDSTGVEIPPEYFIPGQSIFAWIYVTDEDSGVTLRQVEIPIHKKALVTDQEITPHEQTVIDETIAALNDTIEDIPNQIAASLTEARDSGIFDGKDGSTIWISELAPAAPNYTFNISGLSGTPDSIIKQNDLILYSIGLYKIKSINESTVLADFYVELKDVNALIAPATQGTAGQILSLDSNLAPVWTDPSGDDLYIVTYRPGDPDPDTHAILEAYNADKAIFAHIIDGDGGWHILPLTTIEWEDGALKSMVFSGGGWRFERKRIMPFASVVWVLTPPLPSIDDVVNYIFRATYNSQTDSYTVTSAPTIKELWETVPNGPATVITLYLDGGEEVFVGSDIQFNDVDNGSPGFCEVSLAPGDIGFYQLFGTSSGWTMRLVGFTDTNAIAAPATQGTEGQVLGLDENLSPVWVDQPDGEMFVVDIRYKAVRPSSGFDPPTFRWEFSATANEIADAVTRGKKIVGHLFSSLMSDSLDFSELLFAGVDRPVNALRATFREVTSTGITIYYVRGGGKVATVETVPFSTGGISSLLVTFSESGGTLTADKTFAEVTAAIADGAYVYATDTRNIYYALSEYDPRPNDGAVTFISAGSPNGGYILYYNEAVNAHSSSFATEAWVQNRYQAKAIIDAGGYFTSDTVNGALQEIGAELAGINTLIGSGVIA